MSANGYNSLPPFKFWCQTVLPTVYDDSLSYYELLNKVVDYLNKTNENVEALAEDFVQLKEFVETYFDSLEVQEMVDAKLDEMAESGELTAVVAPLIPELVTDWLDEHVTPTAPVIDNTLRISGAGADARVTGGLFYNGVMDATIRAIMNPKVISFYAAPADEPLDLLTLPLETKAYKSWENMSGAPSNYDGSTGGAWCALRTELNNGGYVSMYVLYSATTNIFIFGRRLQNENAITWGEPVCLNYELFTNKKLKHASANINNFTETGMYWCSLDSSSNKTIEDFPYRTGYLFVINLDANHVFQFCINSGVYVKGPAYPAPVVRYFNGTNWHESTFGGLEVVPIAKLNLDSKKEDWLLTEFNPTLEWWTSSGTLSSGSQNTHSELIPVEPGQKLYGMYFGGDLSQTCGGAFFDEGQQWIASVDFPYENPTTHEISPHPYVDEYVYPHANVSQSSFAYTKMYCITVPTNARFISINLRSRNAFLSTVQSLSTLPIIGRSNTGNRVWRRDDPLRQKKKGKKLYIIGQSGVGYDRASQAQYNAKTEQSEGSHPCVGLQEYIIPYYDVDENGVSNVISLGFSGVGYRVDGEHDSVYTFLTDPNASYEGKTADTLTDADEVLIVAGSNNTNTLAELGNYKSTDVSTLMGALNGIIDYIYSVNATGRVQIYLETFVDKYKDSNTPNSGLVFENYSHQIRMLAKHRGLILIDRQNTSGLNANNFKYFSADANTFAPHGTHMNDYGNKLRGETYLNGLLYGDNTFAETGGFNTSPFIAAGSTSLLELGQGESVYAAKGNIAEFQTDGAFTDCPISWSGYVYVEKTQFYPGNATETDEAPAIYKFTTATKIFQCWRGGTPQTNQWLLIAEIPESNP